MLAMLSASRDPVSGALTTLHHPVFLKFGMIDHRDWLLTNARSVAVFSHGCIGSLISSISIGRPLLGANVPWPFHPPRSKATPPSTETQLHLLLSSSLHFTTILTIFS